MHSHQCYIHCSTCLVSEILFMWHLCHPKRHFPCAPAHASRALPAAAQAQKKGKPTVLGHHRKESTLGAFLELSPKHNNTLTRAGSMPGAGAAARRMEQHGPRLLLPAGALWLPELFCSVRKRSVKGSGVGARELHVGTCSLGLTDTKAFCCCAGLSRLEQQRERPQRHVSPPAR